MYKNVIEERERKNNLKNFIKKLILYVFLLIIVYLINSCASVSPEKPYCKKINLDNKEEALLKTLDCIEDLENYIDHFKR